MKTIYLNNTLTLPQLKYVLCHEILHAVVYSYNIYLEHDVEEQFADLMMKYGEKIVMLTKKIFNKLK